MKRICFCDTETFSEVDIGKCGSYRYIEDNSTEVLLLTYAFGDEPVKCVDLASGDPWPEEFLAAYDDPDTLLIAHNCSGFEWPLFNRFLRPLPPERYFDTMHLAAQCGLPQSLGGAGEAIGLTEEQAKIKDGRALIRYFCTPCKPTKSNGQRERNLPEHDPEKWTRFKEYAVRDVEAMRTIYHHLEQWMPDAAERRFWALDARINAHGVRIDRKLATNAVLMDAKNKEELTAEAIALTGMENPKSVSQIKSWLYDQEGKEFPSLNKKVLADVLPALKSEDAKQFMALRTELSKSSTAKYNAMLRSMSPKDDHVRGCFRFYGANRTGRFCLTGDHEILTPRGWARIDSWTGGSIAVWNPDSDAISFQSAEQVVFPYSGDLIRIEHQRISQLSTPDHKMPVRLPNGELVPRTAEALFDRYRTEIPVCSSRPGRKTKEQNELRILIMTQADGHYTEDGSIKFGFKKLRKVERCKSLLRKAGITYSYVHYEKDQKHVFTILPRHIPLWLREFRSKTFGWWMLDEDADVILDELEHWDCYRAGPQSIQYSTTNRTNADIIQAVCELSGRKASIRTKVRDKAKTPNWNDAFYVDIWLRPGSTTGVRRDQVSKETFDGLVYCAVTPTGYFLVRRNGKVWITGNSGALVQFQNLSKNYDANLDGMRELVKGGHYTALKALYDGVADPLSQLVRTAIIPEEGHKILVADFSAIEARVTAWFAGEEWKLQAFREGQDIYCATASQMFHVPVVKHGINGELRQKGKVAELACGYGGGVNALKAFGADKMGMTDEEMQDVVDKWRDSNANVAAWWKTMENAAVRAVARQVETVDKIGKIAFSFENGVLFMKLPSGRRLAYWGAAYGESRFQPGRKTLSYMGVNQQTKKWSRVETWGGKLVENCWAAGTLVCTNHGWIPIEKVARDDLIWDGFDWVKHDGAVCRGSQRTMSVDGERCTPDHKIRTTRGWQYAKDCDGLDRLPVQLPADYRAVGSKRLSRKKEVACAVPELRVCAPGRHQRHSEAAAAEPSGFLRLQEKRVHRRGKHNTRAVGASGVGSVAQHEAEMHRPEPQGLGKLWWPWYHRVRALAKELRGILVRHGSNVQTGAGAGSPRKQRGLLPGKLPMGNTPGEHAEPALHAAGRKGKCARTGGKKRDRTIYPVLSHLTRRAGRLTVDPAGREEPVYDLLNCGERHQFVILTQGGPLIVHNCVQATARDVLREAMFALDEQGYQVIAHVHDECIVTEPITSGRTYEDMAKAMCPDIPWAKGLPLEAAGYDGAYYFKD